jgi:hypothetical protein
MSTPTRTAVILATLFYLGAMPRTAAGAIDVDLTGYGLECGVTVRQSDEKLTVEWPLEGQEVGQVVLDLRQGKPLIERIGLASRGDQAFQPILRDVDPVTFVVVGERRTPGGEPPGMSVFNVFFDSPAQRPFDTHRSRLDLKRVRVASQGHRATVAVGDLTIGPFAGEWQLTFYRGARLVHVEAVVKTEADRRAFLYDSGLASESPAEGE